jgi:hypothetical protein
LCGSIAGLVDVVACHLIGAGRKPSIGLDILVDGALIGRILATFTVET